MTALKKYWVINAHDFLQTATGDPIYLSEEQGTVQADLVHREKRHGVLCHN